MSETLEERIRNRAKDTDNKKMSAYASDIVELLDARDAKLEAIEAAAEEMTEALQEAVDWYKKRSAPNDRFAYFRCPICNCTWWERGEAVVRTAKHGSDCWIPSLFEALRQAKEEE